MFGFVFRSFSASQPPDIHLLYNLLTPSTVVISEALDDSEALRELKQVYL